MPDTIRDMARQGYGVSDILDALGIAESANCNWKKKYPEFAQAWVDHDKYVREFYEEIDRRRRKQLRYGNTCKYSTKFAEALYEMDDFSLSDAEIAASFNISKSTLSNWVRDYPEFRDAYELYLTKSEAYWNQLTGQYAFMPSKFSQPRLLTLLMANRFGITEKVEVTNNSNTPDPTVKPKVTINAVSAKRK